MLNLPINPAAVVPGLQVLEDFPTVGIDNYQSGSHKSDFSKTLADAVNSHHSKSKVKVASAKEDDAYTQADSFKTKARTINKNTQQNQQQKPTVSAAEKSESKPAEADNQDTTTVEASSVAPITDSNDKLSQDKGKQNTNIVDAATVSAMLAPVLVDPQTAVTTGINNETTNLDAITGAIPATNISTNVTANANGITNKIVNNAQGQVLDFAAMLNASNQVVDNSNSQVTPIVPGNRPVPVVMQNDAAQPEVAQNVNPSVQQTVTVTKSVTGAAVAIQNLQGQPQTIIGGVLNQASQNQPTATNQKIKSINNLKPSELTNGKIAEAQTPVMDLQAVDALSQSGDGLKGMVNGMLPISAGKDNQHSTSIEKGLRPGDPLAVTQLSDKAGKVQTLNMPVIQTQLSVNNPNDKARDDIALVAAVHSQQTTEANTDMTKATVNHVNKDDLFAQIVEKAKISINNGNGEMEISLKPDHLGKLHLKVSVENQLVTAKFVAESQQVKEVIETNLNQLRRNLQDTGIQVDQLMVSVGQQNNDSGFQQTSHNSGGFSQHSGSTAMSMTQEIPGSSQEHSSHEKLSRGETVIDLIA